MDLWRKSFVAIVLAFCLSVPSIAAGWASGDGSCYGKGAKIIGAGGSIWPFGFYGSFDFGVNDAISVGAAAGWNIRGYSSDWRYNAIPILARGAFHPFNLRVLADKIKIREKLDVYVGLAAGWRIGFWNYKGPDAVKPGTPKYGGLILREYVGVRFFFTPSFGVVAEDCHGLGIFNIGVCFKF